MPSFSSPLPSNPFFFNRIVWGLVEGLLPLFLFVKNKMNQSNSGYSGQGHTSHLTTQYSQQSSHPQHLPHTPKHPQTQPHSYGPHSTSTSSYQYPSSSRQTHPGSYRTTTPDYNMMGGQQNDMSHKRKLETISQQDQKRPRLTPSSTQQSNMVMGQGGAGSMTPMKTEGGEKKEDREGEKWDVLQVMGLPKFFSDSTSSSSSRKGNDLKNIPVAEPSPDPEAKKAFIDKTALGQKMRLITHEFKMQVDGLDFFLLIYYSSSYHRFCLFFFYIVFSIFSPLFLFFFLSPYFLLTSSFFSTFPPSLRQNPPIST